jgi:hypothetical protein
MLSRALPANNPVREAAERLEDRAVARQRMSMLPFMQSLVTVGPAVKIHPFDSGEREMAAHENPLLPKLD